MKRSKPKSSANGKSPYRKYGKTPHSYSPALKSWERMIKDGRPELATQFARDWHRQYDPLTGGPKKSPARIAP